jgi:putative acetyltransferase
MASDVFDTRQAGPEDIEAIAEAHRDSIRALGPRFYPPADVAAWETGITPQLYLNAMRGGEVFFVATGAIDGSPVVLGFASDYRIDDRTHGTSVYVRGGAARRGIGSALLRLAEAHAVHAGAEAIRIEASLAGVEFYRTHGYIEVERGETRLTSGHPIAVVLMRKTLPTGSHVNASSRGSPRHRPSGPTRRRGNRPAEP